MRASLLWSTPSPGFGLAGAFLEAADGRYQSPRPRHVGAEIYHVPKGPAFPSDSVYRSTSFAATALLEKGADFAPEGVFFDP